HRAGDDPTGLRTLGRRLQDALGGLLLRQQQQQQQPLVHLFQQHHQRLQQQRQQGPFLAPSPILTKNADPLLELLLHPRNLQPPLALRQAVVHLLAPSHSFAWRSVPKEKYDTLLRRLMARTLWWKRIPHLSPSPSPSHREGRTAEVAAAAAAAAEAEAEVLEEALAAG
ncbi:hypothetical protein Agub_g14390, partial [Astrephomene gubernaculifera]